MPAAIRSPVQLSGLAAADPRDQHGLTKGSRSKHVAHVDRSLSAAMTPAGLLRRSFRPEEDCLISGGRKTRNEAHSAE